MRRIITTLITGLLMSSSGFASGDLINNRMEELSNASSFKAPTQKRQGFFESHKLVMIYSSNCQYCHKFAPVLKRWSAEFRVPVKPVSLDGKPMEGFSNFESATKDFADAAYGDSPHGTPALFIVNSQSKAIYPVLFGYSDYQQLNQRLQDFIPKVIKFEAGA